MRAGGSVVSAATSASGRLPPTPEIAMKPSSLVLLVCGLGLSCGGDEPTSTPSQTNRVDIVDNRFTPAIVQPSQPATVTWTWRGSNSHNVTFEDGQGSSTTQASGTHARTFGAPGTYRYRCTIHSTSFEAGMTGRVTVN